MTERTDCLPQTVYETVLVTTSKGEDVEQQTAEEKWNDRVIERPAAAAEDSACVPTPV